MGNKLSHKQRKIYQAVIIIWLILCVIVVSWIVVFDLQRARTLFTENANLQYQQSNGRVHIIESNLEGFAAMVSVSKDLGRERLRSYAQRMLEQYPYIFMFEIVEKVPHERIESFTEYYRRNIYPDFEVKVFSYESDRRWQPIKAAPYYMPIVFMEPFPERSRKVLGLDLGSIGFFMHALQESETLNRPLSSDPFHLVEGGRAYIVHRPIPVPDQRMQPYSGKNGADGEFVVLVIRADSLLDREQHALADMRELLYKATYSETDPRGHIHYEMARAERYLQIAKAIIVGLDRDGNVNLINRRGCEILGYSEKEILGRNWFETVLPDDNRNAVFGVFQKIMAGELAPMSKYENKILSKKGDVHYIDWNNDIEKNQKGEIVGTLSSGQDITERKRAEEDAQLLHRDMAHVMRLSTMGEMATGMAHELNQPLAALISYCDTATTVVNSLPSPPQKLGEILARAYQAHCAADIIRHLREFVSNFRQVRKKVWELGYTSAAPS